MNLHTRGVTANDVAMWYILRMTLTMIIILFQGDTADTPSSETLSLRVLVVQYIQRCGSMVHDTRWNTGTP